ncbi:hypothetical protein GCM10010466_06590 [Planomonospora alba]|uniref:Single-stranded DNA-binding protein n=1 Tax=Planomonospora alba TaxID=161354 RepID=A0ABP6MM74_9ACTN
MNDIYITLTGNVAAPPRQHTFPDGSRVTSLKVASTSRYFDREHQQWRNGETTYFGVRCFRGLADNVAQSVRVGQPVVVQGRLRIREFVHEGERRFMAEVEAGAVGHDLRWGLGSFSKPQRGGSAPLLGEEERSELDRETLDWSLGGVVSTVPDGSAGLRGDIAENAAETPAAAVAGAEDTGAPDGVADTAREAGDTPDAQAGGDGSAPRTKGGRAWRTGVRAAA